MTDTAGGKFWKYARKFAVRTMMFGAPIVVFFTLNAALRVFSGNSVPMTPGLILRLAAIGIGCGIVVGMVPAFVWLTKDIRQDKLDASEDAPSAEP